MIGTKEQMLEMYEQFTCLVVIPLNDINRVTGAKVAYKTLTASRRAMVVENPNVEKKKLKTNAVDYQQIGGKIYNWETYAMARKGFREKMRDLLVAKYNGKRKLFARDLSKYLSPEDDPGMSTIGNWINSGSAPVKAAHRRALSIMLEEPEEELFAGMPPARDRIPKK